MITIEAHMITIEAHMITIEAHMITIEAHMITRQSSHNVDIPDVLMVGGTSTECK